MNGAVSVPRMMAGLTWQKQFGAAVTPNDDIGIGTGAGAANTAMPMLYGVPWARNVA